MLIVAIGVTAQTFDEYRQQMLSGYEGFRSGVMDRYRGFLDGIWRDYDAFRGVQRYSTPKPDRVPTVPDVEPQPEPVPDPIPQPLPTPAPAPQPRPTPGNVGVRWKDITVSLPEWERKPMLTTTEPAALSRAWQTLLEMPDMERAASAWLEQCRHMRLPHWWMAELALAYGRAVAGDGDMAQLIAAALLLYADMDVKVAITESGVKVCGTPTTTIYARPGFTVEGKNYFVLDGSEARQARFPDDSALMPLQGFDMKVDAPQLPRRDIPYSMRYGNLEVEGMLDAAMIERMADYPSVSIPVHAASVLDAQMRADLLRQLRRVVSGMPVEQATATLLSLVQHAFEYATDQQQFGREKYFFAEELLYYPQCDCEDRSVMFAWMARHVLGLDCILLQFPNHEATAVALTPDAGDTVYRYKGKSYVVADPTYIGASPGMCMPQYVNVNPVIEEW